MRSSKAGLADLKRLHKAAQVTRAARQQEQVRSSRATGQPSPEAVQAASRLFAQATLAVQPLKTSTRLLHGIPVTPTPTDQVAQRRLRATGVAQDPLDAISDGFAPVTAIDTDPRTDISYAAPGVGPDTLRKLKMAYWPVGAQLDLHGLTADQARVALVRFIDSSRQHGTRCVRIIHGKGYGSAGGESILKNRVAHWLVQLGTVQGLVTAPPAQGGTGALLALIRLS